MLRRAQGCFLGQLSGDALGSLVEFQTPDEIRLAYPNGVTEMHDGGAFGTIAGQPTDDSEMALMLARCIIERGRYDPEAVFAAYTDWLGTMPFDAGRTIVSAIMRRPRISSQANGAMMRASPLGIFAANAELSQAAEWARQDAELTHPHIICQQANMLYVMAVAYAIKQEPSPEELYNKVVEWAKDIATDETLREAVIQAMDSPPADYQTMQGWVLIAFQNALWQLLHAPSLKEAVTDTIMHGGDTDTNAAICGALLGAVYGIEAIPEQWKNCVLSCRPTADDPKVQHPRPEFLWPVDAMELAEQLLAMN